MSKAQTSALVLVEDGKLKVKIREDGYGTELLVMKNGYQWSGCGVNARLLEMIKQAITEFQEQEQSA
jgi:hypothetical protein